VGLVMDWGGVGVVGGCWMVCSVMGVFGVVVVLRWLGVGGMGEGCGGGWLWRVCLVVGFGGLESWFGVYLGLSLSVDVWWCVGLGRGVVFEVWSIVGRCFILVVWCVLCVVVWVCGALSGVVVGFCCARVGVLVGLCGVGVAVEWVRGAVWWSEKVRSVGGFCRSL